MPPWPREAEAKRTYENSSNGPNTDKLALAQASLDNAKAQVAAAQNALDNFDLKAPFDGTVMDVNVSANQLVSPQTWVVAFADTSTWYVDTSDLNELDVVKVSPGQKVDLTADALPGDEDDRRGRHHRPDPHQPGHGCPLYPPHPPGKPRPPPALGHDHGSYLQCE